MYRFICDIRPDYVCVENVAALLNRGLSRVLGDLAQSGYDAEWEVLSAAQLGAPHLRKRVFIVAYAPSHARQLFTSQWQDLRNQSAINGKTRNITKVAESRNTRELSETPPISPTVFERRSGTWPQRSTWWQSEPAILRVVNGIPNRVHRLRGLGNAIVPQIPQYLAECIMAREAMIESEMSA